MATAGPSTTQRQLGVVPPVTAATVGFGQGVSLGFSDELGAAIDTGISKLPRALTEPLEQFNALGGHPGLSPLTAPLTYAQRRDEYRARNAVARGEHPVASVAGQVGGGAAVAPLLGPGSAASTPARLALGTAEGAVQGVGVNERPEDIKRDVGTGAGAGLAASVLGIGAQRLIGGAPARNDARLAKQVGLTPQVAGKVKADASGELRNKAGDAVAYIRSSKTLAPVKGNLPGMVKATTENLNGLGARTAAIYEGADAASKFGGMDPVAARQALNAQLDEAIKTGASKAYIGRMKAAIDQVEALAEPRAWKTASGSGTAQVIPSAKLRAFISRELAPTQQEIRTGSAKAVTDAALALKAQLSKHVGGAATELDAVNREIHLNEVIQRAALNRLTTQRTQVATPAPFDAAKRKVGEVVDAVAGAKGGVRQQNIAAGIGRTGVQGTTELISREDPKRAERARALVEATMAGDVKRAQQIVDEAVFGP